MPKESAPESQSQKSTPKSLKVPEIHPGEPELTQIRTFEPESAMIPQMSPEVQEIAQIQADTLTTSYSPRKSARGPGAQ